MVPKATIWTVWAAQVAKWFKMVPKATIWTAWAGQVAKLSKIVPKMGPKAAIWTVWATPYEDFGGEADSKPL